MGTKRACAVAVRRLSWPFARTGWRKRAPSGAMANCSTRCHWRPVDQTAGCTGRFRLIVGHARQDGPVPRSSRRCLRVHPAAPAGGHRSHARPQPAPQALFRDGQPAAEPGLRVQPGWTGSGIAVASSDPRYPARRSGLAQPKMPLPRPSLAGTRVAARTSAERRGRPGSPFESGRRSFMAAVPPSPQPQGGCLHPDQAGPCHHARPSVRRRSGRRRSLR